MADITIDAPRERVYAVIADLAMRPAFCDHFQTEYRLQRIESRGIGAAARFHVGAPRFPLWMETVIAELEEPHMILERGRGARIDRMPIGIGWELVESAGTMCDVPVTFWTEPDTSSTRWAIGWRRPAGTSGSGSGPSAASATWPSPTRRRAAPGRRRQPPLVAAVDFRRR